MTARSARPEDDPARAARRGSSTPRPDCFPAEGRPLDEAALRADLSDGAHFLPLAQAEDRVIGPRYVTLRRRGNLVELPTAWMDELYVLEKYPRQGAARALFAAAERAARDKGALWLDLLAWAFSAPALAFCRSLA